MDIKERHLTTKKVTIVGAVINLALSFIQIIAGWLTHSHALLADGLHTLSDLISDFLVLFASGQSAKQADDNHPYGHGRIETLASVFLGLLLTFIGFSIAVRGVHSIINENTLQPETIALYFAAIAIGAKEFLFHYTMHFAKKIHSSLLESNAWHHRSDVFSSIVVFIGITGQTLGIEYCDIGAAFIVAMLIIRMGIQLSLKAFKELIDTALDTNIVKDIESSILSTDGVYGIHQLRTRSMGGLGYIDVDIEVDPKITVSEGHYIATCVEQNIKDQFSQIQDIKIHIDPYGEDDIHEKMYQYPARTELLFQLYSAWSDIHNSDSIKNVNIHYHSDAIEIDIILSLDLLQQDAESTISEFEKSALTLPSVNKLNIYFA